MSASASHAALRPQPSPDRLIGAWLALSAAMVFVMIVIGGVTRLTESGLSIVEWQPLMGALPPFSAAHWQELFDKYRQFPEYQKVNLGMTLAEFKGIFWLEYIHRLWGRLIGVAFALPLAWFWLRGQLTPHLKPRLLALLVMGGLQGALGWAMVASGLVDRPSVSHYRLAAHLLLAVALYAYTVWLILELGPQEARRDDAKVGRESTGLIAFLFVVLTWGALMAGLRAGAAHSTFPTMSGYWIPPGLFELSPWWINLFENGTTIQFIHRWLAKVLVLGVLALAWRVRRPETLAAAAMAMVQLGLGIATILSGINIFLATAHQVGAVLLLTALIVVRHRAMPSRQPQVSAMV